jgi:hypothetical protein
VLGLKRRKFIASRLPLLAGSDLVVGHRWLLSRSMVGLGGSRQSVDGRTRTLRPARHAELIAVSARRQAGGAKAR